VFPNGHLLKRLGRERTVPAPDLHSWRPLLRRAMAMAKVSWSMGELLARVARPANEGCWVELAQSRTVASGTADHIHWELGPRNAPSLIVHGRERHLDVHSGQPTRLFETTTSSNHTFWSFSGA
jgi:hypothetical protein